MVLRIGGRFRFDLTHQHPNQIFASPMRQNIIKYLLIALIILFFAIPLFTICFNGAKGYSPKRIASLLLLVCR